MILQFRKGEFDLRFRRKHSIRFLIPVLLIFGFVNRILAQPGGCYSYTWKAEYCRGQRTALINNLQIKLNELDEKIARESENAELYYERGKFYTNIMYEIGLGFKNVEFDDKVYFSDVDAKAVADFTRAINLSPKTEYYENRGRIYASYWEAGTSGWFQNYPGEPVISNREIFEKIDRLFLNNANFKQAESDFLKAIELGSHSKTSENSLYRLQGLRAGRAYRLGEYDYIAELIGSTKAADVALSDLDFGIELVRARTKEIKGENLSLQSALLTKADLAEKFGRDETALGALNEAIKTIETINSEVCNVYASRADIYLRRQKPDLAIRDITAALEKSPHNCRNMLETRGDIYRKNGERNKAIEDYTALLNFDKEHPYLYRELYWKRGSLYFETGDYEKTVADFTTAIGTGSICFKDYLWRAKVYRLIGNEEAAFKDEKESKRVLEILKNDKPSDSYCSYSDKP